MTENVALAEGRYAFRSGQTTSENPYPFSSASHTVWLSGFWEARTEQTNDLHKYIDWHYKRGLEIVKLRSLIDGMLDEVDDDTNDFSDRYDRIKKT
jgi:hypothetical protein